jgi:hypothetical protein
METTIARCYCENDVQQAYSLKGLYESFSRRPCIIGYCQSKHPELIKRFDECLVSTNANVRLESARLILLCMQLMNTSNLTIFFDDAGAMINNILRFVEFGDTDVIHAQVWVKILNKLMTLTSHMTRLLEQMNECQTINVLANNSAAGVKIEFLCFCNVIVQRGSERDLLLMWCEQFFEFMLQCIAIGEPANTTLASGILRRHACRIQSVHPKAKAVVDWAISVICDGGDVESVMADLRANPEV